MRARRGDSVALAFVFERYSKTLLLSLQRLLNSREEAEDVLQDVFVALPEALAHYREVGRFDGWIRQLAFRLALNRMRAVSRRRESLFEESAASAERTSSRSGAHEEGILIDRMELERAIATLSTPLRAVFVLREVEGYSHTEIAQLLGITRAASELRLFRAIRALRSILR